MAGSSLIPVLAQALVDPGAAGARDVIRAALLHLVALGHLGVEVQEKKVLFTTSRVVRLQRREGRAPCPPELTVILDALFPPDKPEKPLGATEVVYRLQQVFGYDYGRYLARHVHPELVGRAGCASMNTGRSGSCPADATTGPRKAIA
ncbi:MAG: hypothetical protein AB1941_00750 [Gemmatimonadota bacterium]